ncbi:MAG: hypothetical protein WCC57_19140 [Paracoccaceae bacterium]
MPLIDILIAQLTDPFRAGLIIALVFTAVRTEAVTGKMIPLAAGVLFIAAMIPMTLQTSSAEPLWRLFAVGVVANAVWLAVAVALHAIYQRFRR